MKLFDGQKHEVEDRNAGLPEEGNVICSASVVCPYDVTDIRVQWKSVETVMARV
jgi:hypothetical protein